MNQFLLDTNVLLWYFWGSDRVKTIRGLVGSEDNEIFISSVSLWEIAIKIRTGKLDVGLNELRYFMEKYHFQELPMTGDCLKAYVELPHLHKDPFDHMLLAQAISCPMRLITGDSILQEYSSLVMLI